MVQGHEHKSWSYSLCIFSDFSVTASSLYVKMFFSAVSLYLERLHGIQYGNFSPNNKTASNI
jgi:hypothetical protein